MAEQVDELCENFTKTGLIRECERRGLSSEGCKKEMAQRIAYHDITIVANDGRSRTTTNEVRKGKQQNNDGDSEAHDGENDGNSANDGDDELGDDGKHDDNDDEKHDGSDDEHNGESTSSDTDSHDDNDSNQFHTALLTKGSGLTSTPKDRVKHKQHYHQQPYSFRDVEDSIETYGAEDGEDVKLWLSQFEAISQTARWSDEQKMIMCRKKLTGTARKFMFAQRNVTSFIKLKTALINEFAPFVRASDVHRQLAARKKKPNEAIRDYIYEMQRIALSIDLDEPSVCEYIVDGITDDEFHRSLLYEAQTIRQLKAKLLNFEKVQKKVVKPKPNDGQQKKKEQREKEPKKQSTTKKNCFNCGDASHIADDCPQKAEGPKCFNCNLFGHLSKSCTKASEKSKHDGAKKSVSKVNTLKSVDSVNPSVLVNIFDNEISATIDTGSEISLVRKDFWMQLPEDKCKLKMSGMKVRGYGGATKDVCGESVLDISIGNEKFEMLVYVVPKEAIDVKVLIGMDFLRGVNYSITPEGVRIEKLQKKEPDGEAKWIRRIEEYVGVGEIDVPFQYRDDIMGLIDNYTPASSVTAANKLKIKLSDDEVVCVNPRRLAPLEKNIVKKQIDEWLAEGIIQPSQSEYASAVVVVPKKDGSRRVCIDYRDINKKMVRDNFPMPNVEEQIDQLASARVYTTLDLENSYFHVPVDEESRKYTSFVTSEGQFEFLRAPFGLCTSGNAFGRFINSVLKELINDGTLVSFVDDIIIPSKTEEEGLLVLKKVLSVAEKAGLKFNWKKCVFLQRRVEYLGYTIYDGRVEPAPAKIEKVKQFPMPTTVKQLQRFYGLASYFRKFVPSFADIARPLSGMLKKDSKFQFDGDAVAAFNRIKEILATFPVLRIFRPDADTEVHTDASKYALAGIMMQRADDDGKFHPCYYYSRLTSGAEQNYHSYELETLAVVESIKKFRCYLLGVKFKVVTDCRAFKDSITKKKMNARIARWIVDLAEFDFVVEHRPGEKLPHVDALSRANVLVISASVTAQISEGQRNDDRARAIMTALESNGNYDGYSTSNGVLYEGNGEDRRLYVPEAMEGTIIRTAHEKGHFGVKKTKERIDKDYFITGLDDKIKACIATCVPCIVSEKKRGKPEGELKPIPKGDVPLDTLHVDHLGPMPSTRKCYNYILTVIDGFTKFVWLFPTKSTGADETLKKLRIIFDTFGNPRRIISDRGSAFTSGLFTKFCSDEDIDLHTIVTGVPRGNGQVERVHRVIIPMLTKLSIDKPEGWFNHVANVQKCLNSSWQRAIRTTPCELLIGVKMRTKDDEVLCEILQHELQDDFQQSRSDLREAAHRSIQQIQEENKKYYNLRRKKSKQYQLGDVVAIPKTQFGVGQKVKQKYYGPYEIVEVWPNDRYEVRKLDAEAEGPNKTSTSGDFLKPWSLPGRK